MGECGPRSGKGAPMKTCPHGEPLEAQNGIFAEESAAFTTADGDDNALLEYYSACDCCGYMMHHDTQYQVTEEGRTLCGQCEESIGSHSTARTSTRTSGQRRGFC